jgi:phosphatidate cytidylyltransferase
MLRQRILTALVLLPILVIVVLWLPPVVTNACLAAIVLMGAWEWSAFPRFASAASRALYVVLVAGLMAALWRFTRAPGALKDVLLVSAGWWCLAFLWVTLAPERVSRIAATFSGFLVLVPAWVGLARLQSDVESGPILVLFLLVLVWSADIGAYFAGRRLGRTKLAPRVSPGKTWEGVIGGVVAGGLIAIPMGNWLERLPWFFMLCLAVVLASIVGDLTESMFKRYAGLKDSGAVFPGHGGVLDRIDSVTAAVPFFVLGLGWLGVQL